MAMSTDFFDKMAPIWSNQMAKQYNKDMAESEVKYNFPNMNKSNEEVMRISRPNDVSFKGSKDAINPSHYQGIVGNYQYIECMELRDNTIIGKLGELK
jgi:hypothetical protein